MAQSIDPVTVHFNPKTGEYRYPGSADARMPPGYVRQDLRTFGEIDSAVRRMNAVEARKADQTLCREQQRIEHLERGRGDLRMAMQSMPAIARDYARYAIDTNNSRRPKAHTPNLYHEAREFSASNREVRSREERRK